MCVRACVYSKITCVTVVFFYRLVWSWELLEELVLSGNRLECVPAGVSRLRRLRVLRVHSNPLTSLPRLAHLSALKVSINIKGYILTVYPLSISPLLIHLYPPLYISSLLVQYMTCIYPLSLSPLFTNSSMQILYMILI